MTETDRARLRRIAYGPDATPQARAAAEESLRRLDAQEQDGKATVRDEADVEAQHSDESDNVVDESAELVDGDDAEEQGAATFWRRSIRVAWLIPIVVGSLAIGYFASVGPRDVMRDAGAATAAGAPAPSASVPEGGGRDLHLGDLAAADSWFDSRQFDESDPLPRARELESSGLSAQDVRLVIEGGDKGSFWVGRGLYGQLCLLFSNDADGSSGGTCVDRGEFASKGVTLQLPDSKATWFGRQVSALPPLVDSAIRLDRSPGDVDAANAWFDTPATTSDMVPDMSWLDIWGINSSDVRQVVVKNAPWINLWIAKQGAGEFCLMNTQDDGLTSAAQCESTAEFEAHGVSLNVSGFTFEWDGRAFLTLGTS